MISLYRNSLVTVCRFHKYSTTIIRKFRSQSCDTSKVEAGDDEQVQPLKYSQSEAAKWPSSRSLGRIPKSEQPPESQLTVVLACIVATLVYFCVLREENDLDDSLRRNLFEQVPGLKEKHEQHLQNLEKIHDAANPSK